MPKVGDRVEVVSKKAGSRSGVVRRVAGALLTIEWESGEESTLIPGPGVLSVVGAGGRGPSTRKSPAKQAAARKAASGKKAAAKGSPATGKAAAKASAPKRSGAKSSAKKTGKKPAR